MAYLSPYSPTTLIPSKKLILYITGPYTNVYRVVVKLNNKNMYFTLKSEFCEYTVDFMVGVIFMVFTDSKRKKNNNFCLL